MKAGAGVKASPLSVRVFPSTLNLRELTLRIEKVPTGNVPTASEVSRVIRAGHISQNSNGNTFLSAFTGHLVCLSAAVALEGRM